jgi:hypothetical protein
VTDLTLKKSLAAAVAAVALLVTACDGRDEPPLGASAEAPTSVFELGPSTVDAVSPTPIAPSTVPATTAPAVTVAAAVPAPPAAVNTSPVAVQKTLDDVLGEVDQALADIDSALADSEDNR